MPLYEYYCKQCRRYFDTIRSIAQSASPAPCPSCGQEAQRLMPSSFMPFHLRDGYPRGLPDRGRPYGPIGPYTTGATHEEKAQARADEERLEKEWRRPVTEEKEYQEKWSDEQDKEDWKEAHPWEQP
ncbi:MAG: zinc ribbon domain-containing protein [Chloroflexi bacterium]|nr:zinc ribbon domain-containing protein [Chloroflexota bacterium]